ncbi:hypothetical protein CaCOL14_000776 [Colletotrichum acutatum]
MDTASNRATVHGTTPSPQTASQILQQKRLQQRRIQSFLGDNNGPRTILSHVSTSAVESVAQHRAETSLKIDDITSKVQG